MYKRFLLVNLFLFTLITQSYSAERNRTFYGQNFEDYILSTVFNDIENGKYVDVGAFDPTFYSVTKYFYDRGWSGINIEPIKALYQKFVNERPRDININLAASSKKGRITFYEASNEQLSTFDKRSLSQVIEASKEYERYKNDPLKTKKYKVQTNTLNNILNISHLPVIHFLKIDVEGAEYEVIKGLNLDKYRPQVLLVGSVEYGTARDVSGKWDMMILNKNYTYIMCDGINKYYVANEMKDELLPKFIHAYELIKKLTVNDFTEMCPGEPRCFFSKKFAFPMVTFNPNLIYLL